MGGLVESQVAQAVYALTNFRGEIASQVLVLEETVNTMEVEIDRDLSTIIARRQPTARDLRLLIAISKTIANLERVQQTLDCTPGATTPCGDYLGAGSLSKEVLDYVLYTSRDTGGNEQRSVTLDFSGTVFELPAGPVGASAGVLGRADEVQVVACAAAAPGHTGARLRDNLDRALRLEVHQRAWHMVERERPTIRLHTGQPRLLLREPDGRDLRIREDHGGHAG